MDAQAVAQHRRWPRIDRVAIARLGPLFALIIFCVYFAIASPRFGTPENFSLILQQSTSLGVLAIGQTLIILTAGIDLACGAAMALGGVVMTRLAVETGFPPLLAVAAGIAATVGIGLVNGGLVSYLRLPAFIVTLGSLNMISSLTQIYSGGQTVTGLPEVLTQLGNTFSIGPTKVSYGSVLVVLMYAFFWYLLTKTTWGRRVYTIGDNREAARLMGIPVRRTLMSVYAIAGGVYGVAALLQVARTGAGDPYAGQADNLDAITAVVLGGTSLFGGRGSIWGTLIGVLVIGILRNGLLLMGVDSTIQIFITGALVIMAVAVDQLARRRT